MVWANTSTSAGGLASAVIGNAAHQERRQPCHDPQIERHQRRNGGTLHLDDDFDGVSVGALVQDRPVDLGDRGRGQWRGVELGEDLGERTPELGLDDAAYDVEGFGGNLVAARA